MGITMTVTDTELPPTFHFIRFIYSAIKGTDYFDGNWHSQEDEVLFSDDTTVEDMNRKAKAVGEDEQGKQYLLRSYGIFRELFVGKINTLSKITAKHRFFFIIGFPRTGGTYLTKQLYQAAGFDYRNVQNSIAHDGFPHLSYLTLNAKGNAYTRGLLQLAEYLTMIESFFGGSKGPDYRSRKVVPKKFTKAVYNFDLVKDIFGPDSEYIVTLRHPLSVCKSVLDRCGGMPEDRKFAVRSNIETWALRDWIHWGMPEKEVLRMDYVKCIIGYWKRYHLQMAMAGIPKMPTASIVPYGKEHMTGFVRQLYSKLGVGNEPEAFKQAAPPSFSAEDEEEARKAIEEVEAMWKGLGMEFPTEALAARF